MSVADDFEVCICKNEAQASEDVATETLKYLLTDLQCDTNEQ